MRLLQFFVPRRQQPVVVYPSPVLLAPPEPSLPPGAEPFDWPIIPGTFGHRMPNIDAFVDWCIEIDLLTFGNLAQLRINHDAFCRLTQREQLSQGRLSRLISHSDRIERWRCRRKSNAMRYRIIRDPESASQAIAA